MTWLSFSSRLGKMAWGLLWQPVHITPPWPRELRYSLPAGSPYRLVWQELQAGSSSQGMRPLRMVLATLAMVPRQSGQIMLWSLAMVPRRQRVLGPGWQC